MTDNEILNENLKANNKYLREEANELPTLLYYDGWNDGYKQGRADAINECIEALGNNIWDIAKLEQLKEKNNDNA